MASCLPAHELSEYAEGSEPLTGSLPEPPLTSASGGGTPVRGSSVGVEPAASPTFPGRTGGDDPAVGAETQPLERPGTSDTAGGDAGRTGLSALKISAGGAQRSFLYYAPVALDPDVPAPVLIVAHGYGQTAREMFEITEFDAIADREGFVVLYPDGQGRVPWNIGDDVCPAARGPVFSAKGDDSAFIDAMLAFVEENRRVDAEHVFVAGLASGGYFASELACERSDIRAVASHSGGSHALDACRSAQKPVLLLHGLADATVPARCSEQASERWVEHNGCGQESDERAVLGGTCSDASGCPEHGQVSLCRFPSMGQGWAGGDAQAASFLSYASASELIWNFFRAHAW